MLAKELKRHIEMLGNLQINMAEKKRIGSTLRVKVFLIFMVNLAEPRYTGQDVQESEIMSFSLRGGWIESKIHRKRIFGYRI